MEQQIRFCTTSDGVGIAYATLGSGPPLVYVCGWPGNLALEWEQDFVRDFLEAFAREFTLVRYDMRSTGLSDSASSDLSLEALVRDLEAVVEDLGAGQVALLSLGLLAGPVAVTYAAAHPERVSRLVLLGAFLKGSGLLSEEQHKALSEFVAAFGQLIIPDMNDPERLKLDPELVKEAAAIHNASAPPEVLVQLLETIYRADITDAAARLQMPALVLHGDDDVRVPMQVSREVAVRIPNAQFVPYHGSGFAAWADRDIILPEIFQFLGAARPPVPAPLPRPVASSVATILFTDMASSTALTQRLGDAKAQDLVRTHNTIVRDALKAHGGSEIKHTGDGIMASFSTASGALECAIAIQRAVERDAGVGGGRDPLSVRIGLNAGEPVAEEADLFGTAVQLASRICDRAEGGEILVSDVVRQLAAGKGFLFADRGEVIPKGFEEPVRLFEVRWRDEA